jgi:ectoine hydroxylase-related dioxygenase (phytanoyl-CoA dioxygenase family)
VKDQTSSNQSTVAWQKGFTIKSAGIPDYDANPADIETFQREGVVLLKGVFEDWVDDLRQGLQRNIDNPENFAFPCESNPDGKPGRFFDSYCNWQLIPEYLEFVSSSCAASIAGQFMQSDCAQFFHEHAFLKAPGTQRATPWHQDLPYYCVDGKKTATVYVSLDYANTEVAVRFVKGSYRWKKTFHPRVFSDGSNLNGDLSEAFEEVTDIEGHPEKYDIFSSALEPGDTIVFDYRTLHGTTDTEIRKMRRAFSTRWMGDDVVYCDRLDETSPPYADHGMQHGDRMREDWFPVLWNKKITG